jgi:hypothetical protein
MGVIRDYNAVFDFQCLLQRQFGLRDRPSKLPVSPAEISDLLLNAQNGDSLCVAVSTACPNESFSIDVGGGKLRLYSSVGSDYDGLAAEQVKVREAYVVMHPDPRLSFVLLGDGAREIFVYPPGSHLTSKQIRERADQFILTDDEKLLKSIGIDRRFENAIRYRVGEKVVEGLKKPFPNAGFSEVRVEGMAPFEGHYESEFYVRTSFPVVSFIIRCSEGLRKDHFLDKIARKAHRLFDRYVPFHTWLGYASSEDKQFMRVDAMLECPN